MKIPRELLGIILINSTHNVMVKILMLNSKLRKHFETYYHLYDIKSINKCIDSNELTKLVIFNNHVVDIKNAAEFGFVKLFNHLINLVKKSPELLNKLLKKSAINGHLILVKKILSLHRFDPVILKTTTRFAAYYDQIEIVNYFVNCNGGIEIDGIMINYMIKGGAFNLLRSLLLDKKIKVSQEMLNSAILYKHRKIVFMLINYIDSFDSALAYSAANGLLSYVKLFVKLGANVNTTSQGNTTLVHVLYPGNSPLLESVKNGHEKVAIYLIKKGADPNVNYGQVLISAISHQMEKLINILLTKGVRCSDDLTPHLANCKNLKIVKKLIPHYDLIVNGDQLLKLAIKNKNYSLVKPLLDLGINPDFRSDFELRMLVENNQFELAELLIKKGCKLNTNYESRHNLLSIVAIVLIIMLILAFVNK
jgi:ankyrin repeat protein